MSHTQRAINTRAQYPDVEGYSQNGKPDEIVRTAGGNQLDFADKQFGQYTRDSEAKERLRTFYDTLNAVPKVSPDGNIQRMAPVSEAEIAAVREYKETEKQKEWDAYWLAQCTPAQPWTMTEVQKIAPDLMTRRMEAIRSLSQYNLDVAVLKHMGHGGNPRLAHLQYMIDQGELDHMPVNVHIDSHRFNANQFSIWNLASGRYYERKGVNPYRSRANVFGGVQQATNPGYNANPITSRAAGRGFVLGAAANANRGANGTLAPPYIWQ